MIRALTVATMLVMSVTVASAQQPRTVRGLVLQGGQPVAAANVFLLETLDGALTDSAGRFSFTTQAARGATVVVQCRDCRELRVVDDGRSDWRLQVQQLVALPALQIAAGRFAAGNAPDAQIDAIGVVRTPGAAADVYRALQTFPGLQPVDEGAGLFVRGGDVAETRVFVNDAVVLTPYKHETPTGGFFGAFDPFLLDGIQFSSGGFGAEYGDALSGVASLRTLGRPERTGGGATVSLAAVSGTASLPLHDDVGVRSTYTRSHTELMFRVNGTDTRFTHVPEGRDASVIAEWTRDKDSSVNLFVLDQWSDVGVELDEPAFVGALEARSRQRAGVLTLQQRLAGADATAALGRAQSTRVLTFGALDLTVLEQLDQLRLRAERAVTPFLRIAAGGEAQQRTSSFNGEVPRLWHDPAPGAPVDIISESFDGVRLGAFAQTDWSLQDRLRIVTGVRADHSDLTTAITIDPRISLALRVRDNATLTAAWGDYHQVPDPEFFEIALGTQQLTSMRAQHAVLGAQLTNDGGALLRVELYRKRYHDLVQLRRDRTLAIDGDGSSRGVDVFAQWPLWQGIGGRMSYSYLSAVRSDPDTDELARSPFDITHVLTVIVDRTLPLDIDASIALRAATGKPVTPITAAHYDAHRRIWEPVYGEPFSERLPAFRRIDASLSRLVPMRSPRMLILFVAVNNLLDRKNSYAYRYNEDYSERTTVRSQFRRSFYFGASFSF